MKISKIWVFACTVVLAATCMAFTASAADGEVAIDEKTFPGEILRDYVSKHYDTDKNGVLSAEEIDAAQKLDINIMVTNEYFTKADYPEVDLTGINNLTALTELYIYDSKIINADISGLNNLTFVSMGKSVEGLVLGDMKTLHIIDLRNIDIKEITFDNLPELEVCDLSDNPALTKLEVSNCAALQHLECDNCSLESFKAENCARLRDIKCKNNKLESLDISDCQMIEILQCSGNKISDLDVTKYPRLITQLKSYNPTTGGDVPLIVDETTKVKGIENIPTQAEMIESVKNENASNDGKKSNASLILFIVSVVVIVGGVVSLVIISRLGKGISK